MSKVILTKGLPASGKSTWALDQSGTVRVNKDSIRMMLYGAPNCGYGKEKRVLKMRDALIRKALQEGEVVIVDDTNFSPKHEKRIEQIAKEFNVPVEILKELTLLGKKLLGKCGCVTSTPLRWTTTPTGTLSSATLTAP